MATAAMDILSNERKPLSPQVVGPAFVHAYCNQLIVSPHRIKMFYRYGHDGSSSVKDDYLRAMNRRVMTMDVALVNIETVKPQEWKQGGVTVLVKGSLTGRRDSQRRRFSQSFFLSPQQGGYILINDMFRFTGDDQAAPAA